MNKNESFLFCLRVRLSSGVAMIRAWESKLPSTGFESQTRLDLELRQNGKVIFPCGAMYCGVSPMNSIDGREAKALAMSCFSLKPGDTDSDFFANYTPEQLAWVEENGQELDVVRYDRYGDL